MKKRTLRAIAALALGASMMTGTAMAANISFSDVPSTHWAYSYVKKATEKGVVSGMGNGKYGVDEKLSNAQFATMICGMFYSKDVASYQSASADWWYAYMETAYQKGILSGTTAGNRRTADKKWTASVVNAEMSRYDMAQVIYNVSKAQSWETPSSTEMFFAMASISDWNEIPTQYQNAVMTAYAKKFLSGLDSKGTFGGKSSMTRGQAAVVLSAMLDAKGKMDAPTYTNRSGKLVDGSDANEDNVTSALKTLKYEFYDYDVWDTSRVYTSAKLGSGSGSQGFAYMLSDRVFGALPVETQSNANRLKPGDVVYLRSNSQYVVVTSVSSGEFDYVSCDSAGLISWRGSYDIDDLGSRDTIYTRYEGKADNDTLANGDEATEKNVASVLKSLKKQKDYKQGAEWNERYSSNVFGRASGDEGFAYMISDEIFGYLDYEELDDVYDMRVGDVVYRKANDVYLIVLDTDLSDKTFTYLYLDSDDEICWGDDDWIKMNRSDTVYTRYPEGASDDDTLSNGKDATEKNVRSILSDLEDDYSGKTWDTKKYKSSVLGSGSSYNQSFAYFISDEIFDKLDSSTSTRFSKMRVGDVLYLYDEDLYVVILSVDTSRDEYTYAYAKDNNGKIYWDRSGDLDELETQYDEYYTRYPD